VNEIDFYGESKKTELNEDIKLLENYIVGVKEFKQMSWEEKLNEVEDYIVVNGRLPSSTHKDNNIKKLGTFIGRQKHNYKNNIQIMKNKEIRNKWEYFIKEYEEYFLENEEIWYNNLKEVDNYIMINKKIPSNHNKVNNIKKLAKFIDMQKYNYKNNKKIMKKKEIRNQWEKFIEKYKEYFIDNKEIWYNNLKEVEKYIITNRKSPSSTDKNSNIKKLGYFICDQKQNYKNNICIMKDKEIRNQWDNFIKKYEEYFLNNEEIWYKNLKEVDNYIMINKKLPSKRDKDNNIKKLGNFICDQKKSYKNNICIMKNEEFKSNWKNFIKKYEEYFLDNNEIWCKNLKEVKNYIILNNKLPSTTDKDNNIRKLGSFISNQKNNYKNNINIMKNEEIRNHWENFIKEYL
jgi:hypothetical protein